MPGDGMAALLSIMTMNVKGSLMQVCWGGLIRLCSMEFFWQVQGCFIFLAFKSSGL